MSAILLVLGLATAFVAYKNEQPAPPLSRPIKNARRKAAAVNREQVADVKAPVAPAAKQTPRVAEQVAEENRDANER
ncbi:MAG TPA: hypothetical protein VGQ82_04315 [Chthoniobacterales bacterium]|nr:hypothetical protein [Chthoniobacterales bacterium]